MVLLRLKELFLLTPASMHARLGCVCVWVVRDFVGMAGGLNVGTPGFLLDGALAYAVFVPDKVIG